MLEYYYDRRDRAADGDGEATEKHPSTVEEATDEELSDAIAGIELDDPHSAIGHGVSSPENSSRATFDLDEGRDADGESGDGRDAESEDGGPFRSLLSRVL